MLRVKQHNFKAFFKDICVGFFFLVFLFVCFYLNNEVLEINFPRKCSGLNRYGHIKLFE